MHSIKSVFPHERAVERQIAGYETPLNMDYAGPAALRKPTSPPFWLSSSRRLMLSLAVVVTILTTVC